MVDSVAYPETLPRAKRANPERLAWGVMLIAFAAFCVMIALLLVGAQYFLFQSSVAMVSSLRVGRGTVGIIEADQIDQRVVSSREITNSAIVSTDPQSQATITFLDPSQEGRLVAAVTLKADSSLDIEQAARPRFEWSDADYRILLTDIEGELDVLVPSNQERPAQIMLETPDGVRVLIEQSGQYTISANFAQVQLINYAGEALLVSPEPGSRNRPVPPSYRGMIAAETDEIILTHAYVDLLANHAFDTTTVIAAETGGDGIWGCTTRQFDERPAAYGLAEIDGREALRLLRGVGAMAHGRTSCLQSFRPGSTGLDVSNYSFLSMRATFKIADHSLDRCGVAGSECPLMLRMDYIDSSGVAQIWYHGFYSRSGAQSTYPLTCDSCDQYHDPVNGDAWYTYESGNLFTLIPEAERPKAILNVHFYASGHDYDVYVSQVSLLAG